MADVYRSSRAGLSVELLFPLGIARIPQPGSRMYGHLTEALCAYWIDTDQVLYRPPQPRLSDGLLQLVLPDQGILIQFSYDDLSVSLNNALGTEPNDITTILEALSNVVSREMPYRELCGPVLVRYWAHVSILGKGPAKLWARVEGKLSLPGVQIQKFTLRLPPGETAHPDVSIDVAPSEEGANWMFLDYNAVIDKEASTSLLAVVSEAFKLRRDLLDKLSLQSDGNEEFASWFLSGFAKNGQQL